MKCHICGEREATVHYIEIIEGKKTSQWLCHECADREGITPSDTASLAHGGLESFLGEMLKFGPAERERARPATGPACPACGYEYRRLQESGMLGCPDCYRAFHPQLLPMLRRFHGDTTYLGKLPRSHGVQAAARREIAQLKGLLEQAVAMESYEEAARLRDEIRGREAAAGARGAAEETATGAPAAPAAPAAGGEAPGGPAAPPGTDRAADGEEGGAP
jgi:protein arginine kinase activator